MYMFSLVYARKNLFVHLLALWQTWVQSLSGENLLVKGVATHSSILAMDREARWISVPELDTTERLTLTLTDGIITL